MKYASRESGPEAAHGGPLKEGQSVEERVKAQYEAFPYPYRRIEDDMEAPSAISPLEDLRVILHYGFEGEVPKNRPLRILVAGGGTGDATTELGRQLRDANIPGEIVYLDLSFAAREAAMARAAALRLTNVRFLQGSLLDLPRMGLEPFDYINCSGVLHHLENPVAGIHALNTVLSPEGCLGIMLYGELGRLGIYPVQEMLRTLLEGEEAHTQVRLAKHLLSRLPRFNWLNLNEQMKWRPDMGDAEIFDRYLHCCDRAYRVPAIISMMESVGLRVVDFVPAILYDPGTYLPDPLLMERLAPLRRFERYAIAELLGGVLSRHSFFAIKGDRESSSEASVEAHMVPILLLPIKGEALAEDLRETRCLCLQISGLTIRRPLVLPKLSLEILSVIDGRTSLDAIYTRLFPLFPVEWEGFLNAFLELYEPLREVAALVLSHSSHSDPGPPARASAGPQGAHQETGATQGMPSACPFSVVSR